MPAVPIHLQITMLAIGFSIVAAAVLLVAYLFFIRDMRKTPSSMLACALLLLSLVTLQLAHWHFLNTGAELFEYRWYVAALLITPPAFYFFSRELLQPDTRPALSDLVHFLPISLSVTIPTNYVVPLALTIGAGYTIWIVRVVIGIRRQVRRFWFEVFFFSFFALLAVVVLVLAIASPMLSTSVFYLAYANMTGLAFVLVVGALISFPELLSDISAAAERAYATSTLKNVDTEQKLADLERVMREDRIYQNENLNLGLLAEALDLTPHQLSELINTRFEMGFSRFIRERRVAEAKRMLKEDRSASVLSISLTTGFKSQSNFYTAFKEITGKAPGEFRKDS